MTAELSRSSLLALPNLPPTCCLRRLKRPRPSLTSVATFETKHSGHDPEPTQQALHVARMVVLGFPTWEQVCLVHGSSHTVFGRDMRSSRSSSSRKAALGNGPREAARMNPTQSWLADAVGLAGPILARGSTSSPSPPRGCRGLDSGLPQSVQASTPLAPGPRSKVQVVVPGLRFQGHCQRPSDSCRASFRSRFPVPQQSQMEH